MKAKVRDQKKELKREETIKESKHLEGILGGVGAMPCRGLLNNRTRNGVRGSLPYSLLEHRLAQNLCHQLKCVDRCSSLKLVLHCPPRNEQLS